MLIRAALSSAWACQAGELTGATARRSAGVAAAGKNSGTPPDGLDVVRLGPLREQDKGGLLVVLLHGWRARGDDLVGLAQQLAQPKSRFLVAAAPLAEPGGGRAWWRLEPSERPAHAGSDQLPPNYQFNRQVAAARQLVQALLRDAMQRYAPDAIAIAGFSQGAMLALDVALAADPPVQRVAVLSGVLLADSLPALQLRRAAPAAVFVSHGRQDPVLPFAEGASIETVLRPHGYPVTFFPFDGGHEIPSAVVARLRAFLFEAAR